MHLHRPIFSPLWAVMLASTAYAADPLAVTVEDIAANATIPAAYALCKATPEGKSTAGENIRPGISWANAPAQTQSFAIIVSDPDVPASFKDASKDGVTVKADAPRQLFFHWGLVDIPATTTSIPGGKSDAAAKLGTPLINDLGGYISDAKNYGGPCPPWNDERVHHYHFTVYALDVKSLNLAASPTVKQALTAIESGNHVLAKSEIVGIYSLNKSLAK